MECTFYCSPAVLQKELSRRFSQDQNCSGCLLSPKAAPPLHQHGTSFLRHKLHRKPCFRLVGTCQLTANGQGASEQVETRGLEQEAQKYESPSFLPSRQQLNMPPRDERVSYTRIQGLSTFPPERLYDKVVMVRCDWNVEIGVHEVKGKVFRDDTRMKASVPTLQYLAGAGARVVVVSEYGTPSKGQRMQHSLKVLAERLASDLGQEVMMAGDCIGAGVERDIDALRPGQILVLENVRFYKEEKANDLVFAQKLAFRVDVFVNDALGPCSQATASVSGVPVFVGRRIAGLQLEKELRYLNSLTSSAARPLLAIVGGGKLSTRFPLLKSLIAHQKCDAILLGSALSAPFLRALGWRTGGTPTEAGSTERATELLELAEKEGVELVFPDDVVCGEAQVHSAKVKICTARHVLHEWSAMDIGPQTIDHYARRLRKAKTVLWVGAVGFSDRKSFANGTLSLAEIVSDLTWAGTCTSIVHGKDVEKALKSVRGKVSHVALGGSATVTLLTGGALPGLAALDEEPTGPPDWTSVFRDPTASLTVDVGCGDGGFLLELSGKGSGNFLGLDLFGHLVDAANARAQREGRQNLYYVAANATTSLGPMLSTYPGALQLVTIQCPTPQFEARGLGRLVLRQPLVEAITEKLVTGGRLFVQSDVNDVASSMLEEIQKHGRGRLVNDEGFQGPGSSPLTLSSWKINPFGIPTQWETHALSKGRDMFRLMYRKH
ncbi:phosphoglycerate [Klebsormidium nitens]|uniref:Phosphoglycerate kinase n=1 Tax=Klebsormidium nitens TaxID=105231 RepID=A0A1Y1I9G2_KLENI|nr:phosphoglycerate [Klebsormidium nitens]|eukprot:GAQ85336.1 phosphoglycerate [Klebsormidium nitens]